MRHLLLALLLAALAPATAQAATVTVVEADGTEHVVDLAQLAPDVRDATYELRAEHAPPSPIAVPAGFSLRRLLRAAGVPFDDGFDFVEVPSGEELALVMRDEALVREIPPVVWEDADGLHFLAPPVGEEDVNDDDFVTSADGGLRVQLATGFPIGVRIRQSVSRVRRGGSVRFGAIVEVGARPGMRFRWYFGEGRYVYGAAPTFRFRQSGQHELLLAVMLGDVVVGQADGLLGVDAPSRPRRPAPRRPDPDPPPPARSQGTGGAGGVFGGIGTGATTSTGSTAPAPPRPRRRAPRRSTPREASGRTVVSGTLLAAADAAPLAGGLPRAARQAAADRGELLQIPTGAWVALGIAALLALGWAIEGRTTRPFWQPDPRAPEFGP
jgi:opacity protein-like surface antigen